jgi:DNA modification methylase
VLAARKLGMDKVPTIELAHLTDTQRKAYIIADNKLALNAGWDMDLLPLEMAGLADEGFDLSLIGFDETELANMFADKNDGLTDPDAVPEPPDEPIAKLGDVWLLGKHRLMCGDSTVATNVETLLGDMEPHLMVTDPPYEVTPTSITHYKKPGMIKGGWMGKDYPVNHGKMFEIPALSEWMPLAFSVLGANSDSYVMSNDRKLSEISGALMESGFKYHNTLVWQKPNGIPNRWYFKDVEFTVYCFKGKAKTIRIPSSKQTFMCNHAQNKEHMSQKPAALFEHYILNSSDPGQAVYEPFSGSGTTIIACEMTGRACHAIELNPAYIDVAVNRWQNFTGEQATREESGEKFPAIKANAAQTDHQAQL